MATKKKSIVNRPKNLSLLVQKKTQIQPYDSDFYSWTQQQAKLLKKGLVSHLDLKNLAEEIESLGRSDKRALRNHLINLMLHLLKTECQPEMQNNSNSWKASIRNARREIEYILKDSPSLKKEFNKMIDDAFEKAREDAIIETGLPDSAFPKECPWKVHDLL